MIEKYLMFNETKDILKSKQCYILYKVWYDNILCHLDYKNTYQYTSGEQFRSIIFPLLMHCNILSIGEYEDLVLGTYYLQLFIVDKHGHKAELNIKCQVPDVY